MICDWGMGSLGPIALGENQEHIFLGKEIARDRHFSEKTAQQIDDEIKGIIDFQENRARELLTKKRAQLDLMSQALIEFETIDGDLVKDIVFEKVKTLDEIKEILAKKEAKKESQAQEQTMAEKPQAFENPAATQA